MLGRQLLRTPPEGTSFQGEAIPSRDVAFIADRTWVDEGGERRVEQAIFDEVFRIIDEACALIVMDFFLYSDFQGSQPERARPLAGELTDALVHKKSRHPEMEIVVITDPVNELYGGLPSPYFERLRRAGVRVVTTDLRKLRDSNPVYSFFWRLLVKPWGNSPREYGAESHWGRPGVDSHLFGAAQFQSEPSQSIDRRQWASLCGVRIFRQSTRRQQRASQCGDSIHRRRRRGPGGNGKCGLALFRPCTGGGRHSTGPCAGRDLYSARHGGKNQTGRAHTAQ